MSSQCIDIHCLLSAHLLQKLVKFCKHLIETFLAIVIKLYSLSSVDDDISNSFHVIYVQHEENQFSIKVDNSSTISAGFSHCAAIVDGSCYLWGSNGVNCALSIMPPNGRFFMFYYQ